MLWTGLRGTDHWRSANDRRVLTKVASKVAMRRFRSERSPCASHGDASTHAARAEMAPVATSKRSAGDKKGLTMYVPICWRVAPAHFGQYRHEGMEGGVAVLDVVDLAVCSS